MGLFFSNKKADSAKTPVQPESALKEIEFAGKCARVASVSEREIRLTLPPSTFNDSQLCALAEKIERSFSDKFQYPITCSNTSDGVIFALDDSGRSQPLKSLFNCVNVAHELSQITDDREQPCFSTYQGSLDYLNRGLGLSAISDELFPILVAKAKFRSTEQATNIALGVVMRALMTANLVTADKEFIAAVNETLSKIISAAIEDLALLQTDGISDEQKAIAAIKKVDNARVFSPPPDSLDQLFGVPVLILDVLFKDLSSREILPLSDDVIKVANQALVDLYIDSRMLKRTDGV